MGIVYEAEQVSLHRRVALKVLPFAAVLDQRQLARFKNEALAAAQLDHPNIVAVFGVGCERAVHFYTMRYIEGQTLAEVIQELRVESPESRATRVAGAERSDTPDAASFDLADDLLSGGLATREGEGAPPAGGSAEPDADEDRGSRPRRHDCLHPPTTAGGIENR